MRNIKGFTLIEMLVTVAIAAVIVSFAVPATRDMQARARVNAAANQFAVTLKEARSKAIMNRRNQSIAEIVPTASGTNWARSGWSVAEVLNNQRSNPVEVRGIPSTISISSSPGMSFFCFEANTGRAIAGRAAQPFCEPANNISTGNVTFRVCDSGSRYEIGKDIQVNQFGRIVITAHPNRNLCNS